MFSEVKRAGLLVVLIGLLAPGFVRADSAKKSGQLVVIDRGNLFSENGVIKAKEEFAQVRSLTARQAMVVTMKQLPADEKEKFSKIDQKDAAAQIDSGMNSRYRWRRPTRRMAFMF